MVAKLQERLELLKHVQNRGGIVCLLFNKKKGSRARKPDVSDYLIKGFRFGSKADEPVQCDCLSSRQPGKKFFH